MHTNILIKVLISFSKKKMTKFKSFAHSPYFNKHKDVSNLVSYLDKVYPNFSEKKCNRATIFKNLFPTLPHNQKKLAVVFTYTFRLLEHFLKTEQVLKNDLMHSDLLLLQASRENENNILLNKYYRENIKGVNLFINKLHQLKPTNHEIELLNELDKTSLTLGHTDNPFLNNKQYLFDTFYLIEKFKDACELIQRSRITKNSFSPTPLLTAATTLINENKIDTSRSSSLELFYDLYLMLKNEDIGIYENFLVALEKKESEITTEETKAIYNHLLNFCIAQANSGKQNFLQKLFNVFKIQLKKGFLFKNNIIAEWHYKNIVTTGLRIEEFSWVKEFIINNKKHLHPSVEENAYTYNLANYYYHLEQYNDVLKLLLQVEYTDMRYNLDAKSLLLRTYYDMEEEEAFISLTDAFKQYLKRNKTINNIQKIGYYNLLKLIRSMFKLKNDKSFIRENKWDIKFKKLNTEINEAEIIFNSGWIKNKLIELENL